MGNLAQGTIINEKITQQHIKHPLILLGLLRAFWDGQHDLHGHGCLIKLGVSDQVASFTAKPMAKMMNYLNDGRLEISNNRSERGIKPFAIGRKGWLFSYSVEGAEAGRPYFPLWKPASTTASSLMTGFVMFLKSCPFVKPKRSGLKSS